MVWFDDDYGYKKKITIDHTKVSGNEIDFPVLISIIDNDLRDEANGGHVKNASGWDIIFTDASETVQFKHEIEKYTNTSGLLVFWVKVSSLSSIVDTDIYIYYGKAGVGADPSSTHTWDSNFVLVSHMTGGIGNDTDSTTYNNTLVEVGTVGNATGHHTSAARDFFGTDDYFTITSYGAGNWGTSNCTLEAWVHPDSTGVNQRIIDWGNHNIRICAISLRATDKIRAAFRDADSDVLNPDATADYTNTNWHYVTGVRASVDTGYAYIDGGNQGTVITANVGSVTGADTKHIGIRGDTGAEDLNAQIEEIRVSDVARSITWVSTCWETQNDPNTFMDWGAEQSKPTPPVPETTHCDKFIFRTVDIEEIFCFNSWDTNEEWEVHPERMVDCQMYDETVGGCFPLCFPICFDQDASSYFMAKTYISNRVQYCNGNASPVDRDTTITKVEIRAYSTSMNSCGPLTAYLKPIFLAGDGDNHSWTPPGYTVTYLPPQWSEWFDITGDTNAPAMWTWDEVNNVGVEHWMVRTECTDANHLDTGRIDLRVTWYDSVTLTRPLQDSLDSSLNKQLQPFNLWEDYALHDKGIAGQPLNFDSVEVGVAEGAKSAAQVVQDKLAKIHIWMENNYNVLLDDFGSCFDAEYAIKNFTVQSMIHPSNYIWKLQLEKVGI